MCHYVAIGPAAIVRGVRFVGGADARRVRPRRRGWPVCAGRLPQPMTAIRWWSALRLRGGTLDLARFGRRGDRAYLTAQAAQYRRQSRRNNAACIVALALAVAFVVLAIATGGAPPG